MNFKCELKLSWRYFEITVVKWNRITNSEFTCVKYIGFRNESEDDAKMELDNIDVLLGMIIGCIILGIGLSLFFTQAYTGYGAVVLAIGMMTMSLMITARPRVIERVKRENMLQPTKPIISAPAITSPNSPMAPQNNEPASTPTENSNEPSHANEMQPTQPIQPSQPQTQESAPEQKEKQETPVPVATPS